jgi:hypothetical protein
MRESYKIFTCKTYSMEVVVIADVHSNLPALEAVLAEVGDLQVYSCGDVVGYNPFPNETRYVCAEPIGCNCGQVDEECSIQAES